MSEQVEPKVTEAVESAEEAVNATVDAAVEASAEIEEAVEAGVADVVAEAAAVEAEAEEAVAEAVAEAAAIEDAVEEAVVDAIEAGADDETIAEMVEEVAEIEEAVEAEVAEVIVEADAVAEAAEEAVAEAVAEAAAIEEATEEAAAELVAEAVASAEEAEVEEAVAEAVVEEAVVEEAVVEEAVAEAEAATEEVAADGSADVDESGRVVRVLSVGMEVDGKVKRITEFGAFVDIGVGRDGLVHISEMSVRRVAKVSDVLKEGQEVKAWIKQLDRERNRISLTLIPPGVVTIRDLEKGDLVNGTVTRIVPYGAFVDIGVGRDALLHIREMAEGYVKRPEDVVQVGEELEARIIDLSKRRGRIDLSIKGLRPEPQAEVAEEVAEAAVEAEEEVFDDPFADVEVLSPIELAFQKAMAENEDDVTGVRKKKGKRARRAEQIAIQDEIIARTLEGRE